MSEYECYEHWGQQVYVKSDLKGKHRKHCLCFSCKCFKPNTVNNCHIAQAAYENCAKFGTVTPVWECPKFRCGEADLSAPKK